MTGEALGSTSNDEDNSGEDYPNDNQSIDYSDLEVLHADRHQRPGRKTMLPTTSQARQPRNSWFVHRPPIIHLGSWTLSGERGQTFSNLMELGSRDLRHRSPTTRRVVQSRNVMGSISQI